MNFRSRKDEEPDINLIPFIDVLLVILIFLMLTTTYSKYSEMQLKLPVADVDAQRDHAREIVLSVNAEGQYSVNKQPVRGRGVADLAADLKAAATAGPESVLIIYADANTRHQGVISAMEAARQAGLTQITFATVLSTAGKTP